jgi:uncharacterized protein YfaS (alpha-2-macroglobulin family)
MESRKARETYFEKTTRMGGTMTLKSSALKIISAIIIASVILSTAGCGERTHQATATPTAPLATLSPTPTVHEFRANTPFIPRPTNTGTPAPTVPSPTPTKIPTPKPVVADSSIDLDSFPPQGPFVVHFDLSMDPKSSHTPILAFPYVDGVSSWDSTNTILSFQPSTSLELGGNYTFFLDPALSTVENTTLPENFQWQLKVDSGPKVTRVTPSAGQLGSRKPLIAIRFDRPMSREYTEEAISVQPSLAFTTDWLDENTVRLLLSEPMELGIRYDFFIAAGDDAGAVDKNGIGLAQTYVWSYWPNPLKASVKALDDKHVAVEFNTALKTEGGGFPFTIQPNLPGIWEWKSATKASFTTNDPIPFGRKYTLVISGELKDEFGSIQPEQGTFSFAAPPPIQINSSRPSKSWTNQIDSFQVDFSIPVDHASAERAFSISPSTKGKFTWSAKGGKDILVFQPSRILEPNTQYEIRISPSLLDKGGNRVLLEQFAAQFNTGYYDYYMYPSFGGGADSQIVDADGWRFVQYGGWKDTPAHFELYGYSLNEFASLYANQHGDREDWPSSLLVPIPAEGEEPVTSWWQDPKDITGSQSYGGPVLETVIPKDVPPGLYVMNYSEKGVLYDQLYMALTSNTLMLKRSGDELLAWLTDIHGDSVPDAEIRLYSTRGEVFQEGQIDENGLYRTQLSRDYTLMFVSARVYDQNHNEDVTIAGLDGQWDTNGSSYDCYLCDSRAAPVTNLLAYIYTDRPIYRPGQSVNFKAILRTDKDVAYSLLPSGTPVKANIRDSRGNLLESFDLATNGFGTVSGSVQLIEEAALGEYTIEIVVNGETHSQIFKVEDYRKPDFEVTVKPVNSAQLSDIVAGDELALEVQANYYFGEPLTDPSIKFNSFILYPSGYGWYGYQEEDLSQFEWFPTGSVHTTFQKSTGGSILRVSVPKIQEWEYSSWYYPTSATFAIEVEVDDGSNQTVTGAYIFTVHTAEETVSLQTDGYFQKPGEPFIVRAEVKNLAGEPVADRHLNLIFSVYDTQSWDYKPTSEAFNFVTDALGQAEQGITLPSGWYKMEIAGQDPRGNLLRDISWMYVFSGPEDWLDRTYANVRIVADQPTYKPYQTARLMIESEFSGPALLTFERGSVINTQPIQLTAPLTVLETQILPEYAPNVYITVNAWQSSKHPTPEEYDHNWWGWNIPESTLRMASIGIKVDAQANALQVDITADRQVYQPGENAHVIIVVKDAQGKPAYAEVSLSVVDEAIFGLSEELTVPIFSAFYRPRPNTVRTYDSMSPNRIIVEPGGRGSGGPLAPVQIRSDFKDTAAWYPALVTDSQGRIDVDVPLPDNLTSWRLTAKAVTINHHVGQATFNIQTKKDLLVQPLLSRILTSGDHTEVTAFIHNYSEDLKTVDVSLESTSLEFEGKTSQKIVVGAGKAKLISWTVEALKAQSADLKFTASDSNGLSDAVSLSIPIRPAVIASIDTFSGEFDRSLTLQVPKPPAIPEASQVTLELNRSAASTILDGLEFLTGYPYGCIEQTMSRTLPNAVVSRAALLLGFDPDMRTKVDPLVKASLLHLYSMQHRDGGWGWWYDDDSDKYQTAWVMFGLAQISQAGYSVDPQVVDRAAAYLSAGMQPESEQEMDVRIKAYALYSLSLFGKADPEIAQALMKDSLNDLDTFSQAALALVFVQMGDSAQAQAVLRTIDLHAIRSRGEVLWAQASEDGQYGQKTMASSLRTTAFVLMAYLRIDPDNEYIPGIVSYLINARKGNLGWGTTNETTYTILALTDYLVSQQAQASSISFEVRLGNRLIHRGTLDAQHDSLDIDIPVSSLELGLNSLSITTDEKTNAHLYYTLTMNYGLELENAKSRGGLKVSRTYLNASEGYAQTAISKGQLVKVRIDVSIPEDLNYVILEDHLPSGLEALNTDLNTTPHGVGSSSSYGDYYYDYYSDNSSWYDFGYNYKDLRDDRVDFFFTRLSAGEHTYTYLARATFTGQFAALPAEIYAMYDLSKWGRSESKVVSIE